MKRAYAISLAIVLVLAVGAGALFYTGTARFVIAWPIIQLNKPAHGWDLAYKAPAPDYASADSWAALPGHASPANYVPAGFERAPPDAKVDVFFIHPTGYMKGYDWNSPLDAKSATEENTKWMMANQASVFNGCCNVYAPRYREASIYSYLAAAPDVRKRAMDFAYADVDRAFSYFLEHYSHGRPFIIASHSQGTQHGFRLLKARIDGTPLANRMVAAYLIGGGIEDVEANALKTVHVCNSPSDLHCFVHWATWGESGKPDAGSRGRSVCVNPVSWKRDGGMTPASSQMGAAPTSGNFSVKLWGNDAPNGVAFVPLAAPLKRYTRAECRNGVLFVDDQNGEPFDYPLFAIDMRENAIARAKVFVLQQPATTLAGEH